jgi:hypothetical protein
VADRDDESEADAGRRALEQRNQGLEVVDAVAASPIEDDTTEEALWARIGRVLRRRDPDTYRQLRALGCNFAALLDAPVEN